MSPNTWDPLPALVAYFMPGKSEIPIRPKLFTVPVQYLFSTPSVPWCRSCLEELELSGHQVSVWEHSAYCCSRLVRFWCILLFCRFRIATTPSFGRPSLSWSWLQRIPQIWGRLWSSTAGQGDQYPIVGALEYRGDSFPVLATQFSPVYHTWCLVVAAPQCYVASGDVIEGRRRREGRVADVGRGVHGELGISWNLRRERSACGTFVYALLEFSFYIQYCHSQLTTVSPLYYGQCRVNDNQVSELGRLGIHAG